MKINVMISHDKTLTLDVDPNESIENVKALLVQANVMLPQQRLFYNKCETKDSDTLSGFGVKNGEIFKLVSQYSSVFPGRDLSLNRDGSALNQLLRDSNCMAQLFEKDPEFARVLTGNDLDKIDYILSLRQSQRQEAQKKIEAHKKIEAAIQQRRNHPQVISHEVQPFVDIEVNGVPVKALVDSGAGSSVISRSLAERCGLLLDHNYRGIAFGVGQTEIVARIHCAPIKIGSNYYHCPFDVFLNLISNKEVILGLDMLRKHKDNILKLEGGKFSVPFLQEKDMPSRLRGGITPPGEASSSGAADSSGVTEKKSSGGNLAGSSRWISIRHLKKTKQP